MLKIQLVYSFLVAIQRIFWYNKIVIIIEIAKVWKARND